MFLRMLVRAAVLRRGRAASALLAMVVAAAVATAMLNLYVDVQAKLRREFRNYGANVVVVAKDGQSFPPTRWRQAQSRSGSGGIAVPFAYAVARTADGHSVVVAGTDFEQVAEARISWWSVTRMAEGVAATPWSEPRAAGVVGSPGKPFDLSFQGRTLQIESRRHIANWRRRGQPHLYFSRRFHEWTHVPYSTIEIAASGSPQEVEAHDPDSLRRPSRR